MCAAHCSPIIRVEGNDLEVRPRMHARIAPTPVPDLLRRLVSDPFLPIARRELVDPVGGVRRRGSRSREGVDGRDVAGENTRGLLRSVTVEPLGEGRRTVLGGGSLVTDDGVRRRLHILMPKFQIVRDNLTKFRRDSVFSVAPSSTRCPPSSEDRHAPVVRRPTLHFRPHHP